MGWASGSPFVVQLEGDKLTSLRFRNDRYPTDYVAPDKHLGDVHITTRTKGGTWHTDTESPVRASSQFRVDGDALIWQIELTNTGRDTTEVGDLSLPLPMNGHYRREDGMTMSVFKHSFISGDGSFLFWMRPNSVGPFLLMTPEPGTTPEFWDTSHGDYRIYLHAKAEGGVAAAKGTHWRTPLTSRFLKPAETVRYAFRFRWAKDYSAVRQLISQGQVDVQVVPGMTVPSDLEAKIALKSTEPIQQIVAEFPAQTHIKRIGRSGKTTLVSVRFDRLGENRLTVVYGTGRKTYLEFFSTEPIETLIKKRAAFLTKCQHRDPAKWYDGLISEWNMESQTLLGPDNYDRIKGWRIYEVSCDDPGLAKPAFLAAKNAEFPDQQQVDALDLYIDKFVWGGLQQTTKEPYPYAIYGIPDWKKLRESTAPKLTDGKEHLWRVYDYPHIMLMYDSMYRMAVRHPEIKTKHNSLEYLRRAYGTAHAMYTIPDKLVGWSPYETGYYNELVILDIIADLEAAGMSSEASDLRRKWEEKVRFFVSGKADLFGSEYAFDSTGFESTHALARYAMEHTEQLGVDSAKAKRFLDLQMKLNLFCRGVIEPAYYYLGSDYRGEAGNAYTLTYMSQMGGWSVLDYGLHYAKNDPSYLRLGYASILSAWALMNTGTAASNYGYWYPGAANDGGAGGGFEPAPYGMTWLDQPHHRGSWYYGCEIDLGFSGALRGAATVVVDDPLFGRTVLGGVGAQRSGSFLFEPRDGLRKRVNIRTKKLRFDVALDGARFAKGKQIELGEHQLIAELTYDSKKSGAIVLTNPTDTPIELLSGKRLIAQVAKRSSVTVKIRPKVDQRITIRAKGLPH